MLYEFTIIAVTLFFALLVKWFIEPYSVYNRRITVKEFDIVENGKPIAKQQQGSPPFLLSETQEQFDLTLVVPAYNEEERLPSMLKDHISYLQSI